MLNNTSIYALRTLIHLANQPEDDFHQTPQVAAAVNVPSNYLGKLLQKLARARIVESQKGLHGGFRIAALPEQIHILDVLKALQALPRPTISSHDQDLQPLESRLERIEKLYMRCLARTTLADVMKWSTEGDIAKELVPEMKKEVGKSVVLTI
jgi:Rrf2 family protein